MKDQQESLFSKAYCPLAQQYFSAGVVWSLPLGGPLPPPLLGVLFNHHFQGFLFCHHFQGDGEDPLLLPLEGGTSSTTTSRGGLFHHHFGGDGSHVTYPIMLLFTTIEFSSASWAKFTCPPPDKVGQKDWLTDKHVWKHYLHASYVCGR